MDVPNDGTVDRLVNLLLPHDGRVNERRGMTKPLCAGREWYASTAPSASANITQRRLVVRFRTGIWTDSQPARTEVAQ